MLIPKFFSPIGVIGLLLVPLASPIGVIGFAGVAPETSTRAQAVPHLAQQPDQLFLAVADEEEIYLSRQSVLRQGNLIQFTLIAIAPDQSTTVSDFTGNCADHSYRQIRVKTVRQGGIQTIEGGGLQTVAKRGTYLYKAISLSCRS